MYKAIKINKCNHYCVCHHCTKARCSYGFRFGERYQPACTICVQLHNEPKLTCDYFQNKHVHKVYKVQSKGRRIKAYDLLCMIAEKQGIDLSGYILPNRPKPQKSKP